MVFYHILPWEVKYHFAENSTENHRFYSSFAVETPIDFFLFPVIPFFDRKQGAAKPFLHKNI